MRHRNTSVILDRKKGPRELMLRNLAGSVILYEKITTTLAKAKAVRSLVEHAITVAKQGDLNARRTLLKVLPMKNAARKVFEDLAPRYKARSSGYTRIIKVGPRSGDGAAVARIELV